ncbi:MAG: hypothetical protein ABI682_03265 [Acidobacteriota bacterium]
MNSWSSRGPEGGVLFALTIDPTNPAIVYAGSQHGGAFRSADGGATWYPINNGLPALYVQSIVVDPIAPSTIYAALGIQPAGIFKSTNSGTSWAPLNDGLPPNLGVSALLFVPWNGRTLYAAAESALYKTSNGGASWTRIETGIHAPLTLAADPSTPGTLYIGTFSSGIFKTVDGGATWTPINSGLTNLYVWAIAIDPSNPATVYAGTDDGVFKSTDRGATWTDSSIGIKNVVYPVINAIALDPLTPATVYAALYGGVYKSTNGGSSWTLTGLKSPVFRLAIPPSSPSTLLAGSSDGVFKSIDGGNSWTRGSGISARDIRTVVIDPSSPSTLYAADYLNGMFKSTDGGVSWIAINTGLFFGQIYALAIDPLSTATLYAGIYNFLNGGVFKTINGGANWTRVTPDRREVGSVSLAIDPVDPARIYAGDDDGSGSRGTSLVEKSTNGGQSWAGVIVGTGGSVNAIAIDPSNTSIVYAATGAGVYKSTDAGLTWISVNTGLVKLSIASLTIDPHTPTTLYAGGEGLYKSVNGGASWNSSNNGIGSGVVRGLSIDLSSPEKLYAATSGILDGVPGSGVFRSENGGATWVPLNNGLPNVPVYSIAIDPSFPNRLLAATGSGVYEYTAIEPCLGNATTLCLNNGKYRVATRWSTADGQTGVGQAVSIGADSGYFTFFSAANVEMLVKVLDGCRINGKVWTFAGGLTDVNVVMTVTETDTGLVKIYTNPQGRAFQPIQDTAAFSCTETQVLAGPRSSRKGFLGVSDGTAFRPKRMSRVTGPQVGSPCLANSTTLCLNNGRFEIRTQWLERDGTTGMGQVVKLTSDTGAFWFFSPGNVEMAVKVLNGCPLNSHYWTFAAGLTDVDVFLTVRDTQTGTLETYVNPQGTAFRPIQDTNAFAGCP